MRLPICAPTLLCAHRSISAPRALKTPQRPIQHPIYNEATDGVTNLLDRYDQFSYAHLVHPPGFWRLRPEPHGLIENMFLAGDYVRCATDLATMEAANETARGAVNALLDVDGSSKARCTLFPLIEPKLFDVHKAMDRDRYLRGEPHLADSLELSRGISTGVYNASDAEAADRQVILQLGRSTPGAARIPRLILR